MSLVFMDSVGLLALWSESDQWHDSAEEAFTEITGNQDTLLTTTFILLECGNAAAAGVFVMRPPACGKVLKNPKL